MAGDDKAPHDSERDEARSRVAGQLMEVLPFVTGCESCDKRGGLGIAIAKNMLEQVGGRIALERANLDGFGVRVGLPGPL